MSIKNIPIGISKKDLEIKSINFDNNIGYLISSNKIQNTEIFTRSLISLITTLSNDLFIIMDPYKKFMLDKNKYPNYYIDNFEDTIKKIDNYITTLIEQKTERNGIIIIYGIDKLISKLENSDIIKELMQKIKKYEKVSVILIDDESKLKEYNYEEWFKLVFNTKEGLWIGKGITEQSILKVSNITRAMNQEIKNNLGYIVEEGISTNIKLIDFYSKEEDKNE